MKEENKKKSKMSKMAKNAAILTTATVIGASGGVGLSKINQRFDTENEGSFEQRVEKEESNRRADFIARKILEKEGKETFYEIIFPNGDKGLSQEAKEKVMSAYVENYISSNILELTNDILKSGEANLTEKEAKDIADVKRKLSDILLGGIGAFMGIILAEMFRIRDDDLQI